MCSTDNEQSYLGPLALVPPLRPHYQYVSGTISIWWGFHKWGYKPLIYFSRIFHYKPTSSWDTPINGNPHMCVDEIILAGGIPMFVGQYRCFSAVFQRSHRQYAFAGTFWENPIHCRALNFGFPIHMSRN